MKVMSGNYKSTQAVITRINTFVGYPNPVEFEAENKYAVITKPELLGSRNQEIINTLLN